jgi:hypothetical protein
MHTPSMAHDTLKKFGLERSAGIGGFCTDHTEPSQDSAKSLCPTARHFEGEEQETPTNNWPAGLGLGTMVHAGAEAPAGATPMAIGIDAENTRARAHSAAFFIVPSRARRNEFPEKGWQPLREPRAEGPCVDTGAFAQ